MARRDPVALSWTLLILLSLTAASAGPRSLSQAAAPDFAGLLKEAQNLMPAHKPEEAGLKFDAIRVLAHEHHEDIWEARAIAGMASALFRQAKYPQAKERYDASLAIFERLDARKDAAGVNLGLGNVAWYMGDLPEAKARYEKAVSIYEALGEVMDRDTAIFNLLKVDGSDRSRKEEIYRRLQEDAIRAGDAKFEAQVLHSWGDTLFNFTDYSAAIQKLERAESLCLEIDAREELATVYNSLGRIYRGHGQKELALEYQLKALEIHKALQADFNIIQSTNAVGVVYESMGKNDLARAYYERALALAEKTSSPRIQDFVRGNLAWLLVRDGQFARGAEMLEQVLSRARDTHAATRYYQLSCARLHLGRDREALEAAQRSADCCRDEGEAACLLADEARAKAYLALGNRSAAEADLRSALARLEDLHARLIPEDFLKQSLHRSWEPLYSLAIDLNFRGGNSREALETAELARSRAFLDLLAERKLSVENSDGIRNREWVRGPASPVAAPAPTASDVTAIAARLHSTLLIYWVADDAVYIWVVDRNGVAAFQRVSVLRSRLQDLVLATTSAASGAGANDARDLSSIHVRGNDPAAPRNRRTDAWDTLYNVLIKPVRTHLPGAPGARITVVPHGPLLNLSFAALRDPNGHYLIEHYAFHYVPASAVLQFTESDHAANARNGSVLLIADPASPASPHGEPVFSRLPGARLEVQSVARLFPKDRVTVLMDSDATEARVREESAHKAVIHFATHAIVLDGNPFSSYLALAAPGGAASDGLLTAQKIYGMRFNADMVVLSACRSAAGLVTGDGIAALGRAFFYAGTSSVVASLWNVPDRPTDQLLKEFYRFWLSGQDKDHALRTAQLRILDDLRSGKIGLNTQIGHITLSEDPAFWAGFVLLGEPD